MRKSYNRKSTKIFCESIILEKLLTPHHSSKEEGKICPKCDWNIKACALYLPSKSPTVNNFVNHHQASITIANLPALKIRTLLIHHQSTRSSKEGNNKTQELEVLPHLSKAGVRTDLWNRNKQPSRTNTHLSSADTTKGVIRSPLSSVYTGRYKYLAECD